MNKSYNRRSFLKTSFIGAGTLLLSLSPIKSYATNKKQEELNLSEADSLYIQAKEYFYKKDYNNSEVLYLQLIKNFPNRIIYYDGYAKVLGAQQKALKVAELYRLGHNANKTNAYFMHRLSLSLRNLCIGNRKAEKAFVAKYGIENIMIYSVDLLLAAIAIKKVSGFMLDLRDIPVLVSNRNQILLDKGYETISLPSELINTINSTTVEIASKWVQTRSSRKEHYAVDVDADVTKLKNKKRRKLYSEKEKGLREEALKNAKKKRWLNALSLGIEENKPAKVDKFGILILTENTNDANTVGKLRRYYRKYKYNERLITLNRFLYAHNNNLNNALALASTLIKHSKDAYVANECTQLLNTIEPYINTLPPVIIGSYFITQSQIDIKNGKRAIARTNLLKGIKLFEGKGGVAYTLIEKYASSYTGKNMENGISILKAICNKDYKKTKDEVWIYVEKYIDQQKEKSLNPREKIKQLNALSKLQIKTDPKGYNESLKEIESLKANT